MEDFDNVLDEAIRSYSDRVAAAGLERQILRRVQEPLSRRRWWWAVPALAMVVIIAVISRPSPKPPVRLKAHVVGLIASTPPVIAPVATHHHRRAGKSLSPERELVSFLDRHPAEAAHVFSGDNPIVIERLHIQDLP